MSASNISKGIILRTPNESKSNKKKSTIKNALCRCVGRNSKAGKPKVICI